MLLQIKNYLEKKIKQKTPLDNFYLAIFINRILLLEHEKKQLSKKRNPKPHLGKIPSSL